MHGLKKPNKTFNLILSNLLPQAEQIRTADNSGLTAGTPVNTDGEFPKLFLLEQGYVHVRRKEDGLIFATVFSPYILGLSFYPGAELCYFLEMGPNCRLHQIPRRNALITVKKNDLFREWMHLVSYKMAFLYSRDKRVLKSRSKDIVTAMLLRLMDLPEDFREHISALSFIEQRTTLSRSCIQRALAELKFNQRITLQDGRLVNINNITE